MAAQIQKGPLGTFEATTAGGRRALLLVNRASRRGAFGIGAAQARLAAGGIELHEVDCGGDASAAILAHRGAVDCVILGGGDGTVNAAGRGLVETGLPMGLLPLGTANDFARSVGVPFDLEAAARVIVGGFTHKVDVGEVNGHPFFNVASVGLAADLAKKLTREGKRRFGRLSYAIAAVRVMLQARPFHATLLAGQDKVMVRTMQIAVGNGRYYGGGNVIVTDARIDDGRLDLYSLEFAEVWRMALMLPHFKRGAHGVVREVRTARGLTFEVVTRRPRSVNVDGELVTKTPAVFTQKQGAVTVYVPESCPLLTAPA